MTYIFLDSSEEEDMSEAGESDEYEPAGMFTI